MALSRSRLVAAITRTSARIGWLPPTARIPAPAKRAAEQSEFPRQLPDFIQENGSSLCQLKPAQAPLQGSGKGAFLMAEQLRGNQRLGVAAQFTLTKARAERRDRL
jgi:hypothetical protein